MNGKLFSGYKNNRIFARILSIFMILAIVSPAAGSISAKDITAPASPQSAPGVYFYDRTLGVTQTPYLSDPDHFYWPTAVDVDHLGNIWISDEYGARVLKYNSTGTFISQIGKTGFTGLADETHFSSPIDIAEDGNGNIWVVDLYAHRLVKFSAGGIYLSQIGVSWQSGADNTHFDKPWGIAFDSAGTIYVSDLGNHRVQVFDSTGFYVATIGVTGEPGADNAHFNFPAHIATDDADNLYVADNNNHRVQIFNKSRIYVATIGTGIQGSSDTELSWPGGVAVDETRIYIADSGNYRIQIFDRATRAYLDTLGSGQGDGDYQFNWPDVVEVDGAGNIYVVDKGNRNTRVQVFDKNLTYVRTFGTTGVPYLTDAFHYNQPNDVAVAEDGTVAIVEGWGRGNRLVVLNPDGSHKFTVGTPPWGTDGPDGFQNPFGVAFDASGKIFVADCENHRVQVFNSAGGLGYTLGSYGTGNNQFNCPAGIAFDSSGNIYIADGDNHRIQIFDKNYTYLHTIGVTAVKGTDNAHFNWPMDVAVDSQGNIYVADTLNQRVQMFNSSRVWVKTYGVSTVCGNDNAHLCEPWGLAIDAADNLYVGEKFNPRVQVFEPSGLYRTTISGVWGSQNGQLREVYGVAVDAQGNVYAADLVNHRIEVYAPGEQVFLPYLSR